MARSTEWESIISKMETCMKDKCTREKCKAKESIHGLIRTYSKALSFKIR
jgi:hypothetical protein